MTDSTQEPREAWSEVGRRFDELGRALRGHFGTEREPAAGAAGMPTDTPGTGESLSDEPGGAGTETGARDRAAMQEALRRLSQAAQRLGDQAGDAVRDPAVRESAQRAARSMGDALAATFSEFGEELRGRLRSRGSEAAGPDAAAQQPAPPREIGGPDGPAAGGGGERPPGTG